MTILLFSSILSTKRQWQSSTSTRPVWQRQKGVMSWIQSKEAIFDHQHQNGELGRLWRCPDSDSHLIETWHRLFQGCLKSYRIAFRGALWLDFGQLSSYLFVYWPLFRVTVSKCYMEFDTNWRIESRDILFKLTRGYLKSISSHIE